MEYEVSVDKDWVMGEVARTAAYVGAKTGDEAAYDRIRTVKEDEELLSRHWAEAKSSVIDAMKEWVRSEEEADGAWRVRLRLPRLFPSSLLGSLTAELRAAMTYQVLQAWFMVTNKEEAEAYAQLAAGCLTSAAKMALHRERPQRP